MLRSISECRDDSLTLAVKSSRSLSPVFTRSLLWPGSGISLGYTCISQVAAISWKIVHRGKMFNSFFLIANFQQRWKVCVVVLISSSALSLSVCLPLSVPSFLPTPLITVNSRGFVFCCVSIECVHHFFWCSVVPFGASGSLLHKVFLWHDSPALW